MCVYLSQWNLRENFPGGFWGRFPSCERNTGRHELPYLTCVWTWWLGGQIPCGVNLGVKPTGKMQNSMMGRPWFWWWYWSHKSSLSDIMPLDFFIVRKPVISFCHFSLLFFYSKKWIYLERNTLHRLWAISESEKPWKKHKPQSVGHNKRQEWPWNIACLVFSPQE